MDVRNYVYLACFVITVRLNLSRSVPLPTHSKVFPQCLGSMHGRLNKKNRLMSHKSDEITILIWAMDADSEK